MRLPTTDELLKGEDSLSLSTLRDLRKRAAQLEGRASARTSFVNAAGANVIVGTGNPFNIEDPFTGTAILFPPYEHTSGNYHIFGMNAGVLQWGASSDDGKIYAGGGNVKMDTNGIVLANDANAINFESSTGDIGNTFIYINNNDDLGMFNFLAGKALVLVPQLTNETHPAVRVKEDPGNTNVLQMTMDIGTSGSNFTLGGEVVIWAARDAKETVFNDGSYDVDLRVEGATDTKLLKLDAGLDAAAFGGDGVSGQKLTVYGKTVVTTGGMEVTGNVDTNNSNVRSFSAAVNDDAATSFTPSRTIGGIQVTTSGTGNGGIASYNTITPVTGLVVGGANFAVATGALTGTTGTDTKLTISAHATDGKIYIENRTGATRTIVVLLT